MNDERFETLTNNAPMPEKIWANGMHHWHPFEGEQGTEEYIRADLHDQAVKELVEGLKDMREVQRSFVMHGFAINSKEVKAQVKALIQKYGGENG